MVVCENRDTAVAWMQFIQCAKGRCSVSAFNNWIAPIVVIEATPLEITLKVPNIFVKEYLLSNFKEELRAFLPVNGQGEPAINFVIDAGNREPKKQEVQQEQTLPAPVHTSLRGQVKLNPKYRFDSFIDGADNQFAKSAAVGVATRPGQSYNPLFIHGCVGLGKTHMLHSIGHYITDNNKKLRVQCITTEAFINDLVDSLKNKSIDQMKKFYRSDLDVLLVDDIQFLQNRLNFEEEFCNMFEALINQNKQIVVTSDKPPAQLKLSERMIGRMEWGLVAHIGVPDLETRVAILQHKANQKGFAVPQEMAFYIAEYVRDNVRQLEGVVNRLSAHCRLLNVEISQDLVAKTLMDMMQHTPHHQITVDQILKCVAAVFQVSVKDLKGPTRTKELAVPRQVAMYLACQLVDGTLKMLSESFGKTHSTILHASKAIEKRVTGDDILRRQIEIVKRNIQAAAA